MEIVLQWLDDLDDAVFSVVLAWDHVRRALLQLGAVAAAGLAASAVVATEWVLPLGALAASSVAVAVLGAGFTTFAAAATEARRNV